MRTLHPHRSVALVALLTLLATIPQLGCGDKGAMKGPAVQFAEGPQTAKTVIAAPLRDADMDEANLRQVDALRGEAAPAQPAAGAHPKEDRAKDMEQGTLFRPAPAKRPEGNRQLQDAAPRNGAGRSDAKGEPHPGLGGGKDGKGGEAKKPDPEKGPATWKRDGKSPSFARVYVGDGNALELVSISVTVTVEGPRSRTLVDHIFHNPHGRQLEGTFEYPMPTGASPSYFAMFLGQTRDTVPARFAGRDNAPPLPQEKLAQLTPDQLVKHISAADWGTLQEARVVNPQKALETYEDTVRGRIDPALLEYAGGNTFRGRVFPIPPKGYNRVLIAYEELLPISQEKAIYRFPLPNCDLKEMQFTLQARTDDAKDIAVRPDDFQKQEGGSQLLYTKTWSGKGPGGDVVFAFTPNKPTIQAISGKQGENGPLYVYARVRPELKIQEAKPFARHAVFLLDCSQSEHPDRFAVSMKLLRKILESDAEIQQFNVLAFNVGSAWVDPTGWLPNTPAGRDKVFERLDGVVLEGATDIGAALDKLSKPEFEQTPGLPMNVFVLSDGQVTWGEPDVAHLVGRFEARCSFSTRFHCYRIGLGAENLELFEALTRKGGGIFNVFGEADVTAAASAHRQQCMEVEKVRFLGGDLSLSEVLIAGRKAAVYPGGDLIIAAKANKPGKSTLLVEGKFMGQKFAEEYPIEIAATGELAPRGWAEIAVASVLALNDPNLDSLVTAYCQQFGIASRVASFLVLENPADYKRLDLEAERGKTVPGGDMGKFLDEAWKSLAKVVSAKEAFVRFLQRVDPRIKFTSSGQVDHYKKLLAAQTDADFELPSAVIKGAILHRGDVPPTYLAQRDADRRNPETYLAESRRRLNAQDTDGAVRVLSTIIEEHPTRGDALRLVGWRLLDMKQPVHAARLFERVQRSRPFEPHSYLDLARALEECGKYGMAAVQYELVLAGTWHQRFHQSLKVVAAEEYARMMRAAIQAKAVKGELADLFGDRLEKMDPRKFQSDLRVSISWNTDATDIDLWVIEPTGEKCFYQNRNTKLGGQLTEDVTQGFGPERYVMKKAAKGEYVVLVHYYSVNPNLLAGETHVSVIVTRNAGTPQEEVQRHTVILKKHNEQIEVCRIKY